MPVAEPLPRAAAPQAVRVPEGARVAVLVPCFNEEPTVGKVIDDFRRALPAAEIYVFDNRSDDATARIAREKGAIVVPEPRRGKGHVVAGMFGRVDADYFVMTDGDDTYPADRVGDLLRPLFEGRADMVVGTRLQIHADRSFRPLHVLGNNLVRSLVNLIFGARLTDIMSGYRAYTRRVAEALPVVSAGFEVETELTVNALYHRFEIAETPVPYGERPEGSVSKLRTYSDGFRVVWKIFSLFRAFKPLTFFGGVGILFGLAGLWAGYAPVVEYFETGLVPKLPRAVLATGFVLLAFLSTVTGVILHAVNWRLKELHSVVVRPRSARTA